MKNIVITGASSGIGQAIYNHYKQGLSFGEYDKVIGVSRRGPDKYIDISAGIPSDFTPHEIVALINCAGIMPLPEEHPAHIFNVNFWGATDMIAQLLPYFVDGCCVINIASVSGLRGDAEVPFYAASKAALISITQSYAKRHAPRYRFNCISPGYYKTNLVPGETPEELIKSIPMKYEEDPALIVPIVRMILNTKYMTGANIVVDGGVSL